MPHSSPEHDGQQRKREAPNHWEDGYTPVGASAPAAAGTPAPADAEASDTDAADGESSHGAEAMADDDVPAVAPANAAARRAIDIPKNSKKRRGAGSGPTLGNVRVVMADGRRPHRGYARRTGRQFRTRRRPRDPFRPPVTRVMVAAEPAFEAVRLLRSPEEEGGEQPPPKTAP
jgi:hypothetical protein